MIRRHLFALQLALLTLDLFVAAVVFVLVRAVRFGEAEPSLWTALGVDLRLGVVIYAVAWVAILWFLGLYSFRVRWTIGAEVGDIVVATFMLAFAMLSFLYLVQVDVSRLFLLLLLVVQPVATITARLLIRLEFQRLRARGHNRSYMVVIGTGDDAQAFADAVERHVELGIQVIGHLREPESPPLAVTRPILGDGADLGRILHEDVVDEVAICVGSDSAEWTEPLLRLAADEGKRVRVPTPIVVRAFDLQTEELDGLLVRSYVNGPSRMLSLAVKRGMDIVGALTGLILLSPILLVVAVAIRVIDGSPVLFRQARGGLQGRTFMMYKFRTMVTDAESRLAAIEHLNERNGVVFKVTNDPRVTHIGRFLRSTSIDELPQLWNVLKGEMSLVGPRPLPVREVAQFDVWHRRRQSMKPGITGLWQTGARDEPDFDRWVERDLAYIDRWSLLQDFKILLWTIPAVFGRTGK
ncbi:MAG: sugar transferase [Candidatus Limnocylindrales bacterium]